MARPRRPYPPVDPPAGAAAAGDRGTGNRGTGTSTGTGARQANDSGLVKRAVNDAGSAVYAGVEASGTLPQQIQSMLGPIGWVIKYATLVSSTIKQMTEGQYVYGYAEGYAGAVTYSVFGRDPALLPFIGTTREGGTLYGGRDALPDNPNTPEAMRGNGFFDGKAAAIRDLALRRSPEDFLNEMYRQVLSSRGYEPERRLRYFTNEELLRRFR